MADLPINAVDVAVILILLASGGFAFLRGFVHEVLAVGAWVGAVFATMYGFPLVQPLARKHISIALAADGVAAGAIFLITLLCLAIVTKAASRRVKESALNSVDSSLGFIFGLIRGAVLVSLAYMLAMWLILPDDPPEWLASAKTRPMMEHGSTMIHRLVPEELGQGQDKTKAAATEARRALEVERTFRSLSSPQLRGADQRQHEGQPDAGYGDAERRDMDRLIQGNQ